MDNLNKLKKADLIEELKKEKKQNIETQNKVDKLEAMMNQILANNLNNTQNITTQSANLKERITVKSNIVGIEALVPRKDEEIKIIGLEEGVSLTIEDINDILKKSLYRKLFKDGWFYFEDNKWYEYFGLGMPKIILTPEKIIDILNLDSDEMKVKFDEITVKKTDANATNFLPALIGWVLKNNIATLNNVKVDSVNEYFTTYTFYGIDDKGEEIYQENPFDINAIMGMTDIRCEQKQV